MAWSPGTGSVGLSPWDRQQGGEWACRGKGQCLAQGVWPCGPTASAMMQGSLGPCSQRHMLSGLFQSSLEAPALTARTPQVRQSAHSLLPSPSLAHALCLSLLLNSVPLVFLFPDGLPHPLKCPHCYWARPTCVGVGEERPDHSDLERPLGRWDGASWAAVPVETRPQERRTHQAKGRQPCSGIH